MPDRRRGAVGKKCGGAARVGAQCGEMLAREMAVMRRRAEPLRRRQGMVRRNGAAPPDDQRPITADILVHAIPRMSLRAQRSNLVLNTHPPREIASSLPLLAMTNEVSARYFHAMSGVGEWV